MINFYVYGDGLYKEDVYKQPINDFENRAVDNRLPLIEHIIKKSPKAAYIYASVFIKGRWYEAEPIIKKDPFWVYMYAVYVIKGRWIEAELDIMKNKHWWKQYCRDFGI